MSSGVAGGSLTLSADDLGYITYLINKTVAGIVRTIVAIIRALGRGAFARLLALLPLRLANT